jgi:glutamate-1-semialdehyde 2,1-aminomutase
MELIAPAGPVYHAGTLSGNPAAMAAGLAQLRFLSDNPAVYARIDNSGATLARLLREAAGRAGARVTVNRLGSLLSVFFTQGGVTTCADTKRCDTERFARYFGAMLSQGIYLPPSQFEALFTGAAHTDGDLAATAAAAEKAFCQ